MPRTRGKPQQKKKVQRRPRNGQQLSLVNNPAAERARAKNEALLHPKIPPQVRMPTSAKALLALAKRRIDHSTRIYLETVDDVRRHLHQQVKMPFHRFGGPHPPTKTYSCVGKTAITVGANETNWIRWGAQPEAPSLGSYATNKRTQFKTTGPIWRHVGQPKFTGGSYPGIFGWFDGTDSGYPASSTTSDNVQTLEFSNVFPYTEEQGGNSLRTRPIAFLIALVPFNNVSDEGGVVEITVVSDPVGSQYCDSVTLASMLESQAQRKITKGSRPTWMSWYPSFDDVIYQESVGTTDTSCYSPRAFVKIEAPSSTAQSYNVYYYAMWEVAGTVISPNGATEARHYQSVEATSAISRLSTVPPTQNQALNHGAFFSLKSHPVVAKALHGAETTIEDIAETLGAAAGFSKYVSPLLI
jgi:hypothetical protein